MGGTEKKNKKNVCSTYKEKYSLLIINHKNIYIKKLNIIVTKVNP